MSASHKHHLILRPIEGAIAGFSAPARATVNLQPIFSVEIEAIQVRREQLIVVKRTDRKDCAPSTTEAVSCLDAGDPAVSDQALAGALVAASLAALVEYDYLHDVERAIAYVLDALMNHWLDRRELAVDAIAGEVGVSPIAAGEAITILIRCGVLLPSATEQVSIGGTGANLMGEAGLRSRIVEAGRWLPHQLVPKASELADAHELPESQVRRLLERLHREGLIYAVERGGFRIGDPHPDADAADALAAAATDAVRRSSRPARHLVKRVAAVGPAAVRFEMLAPAFSVTFAAELGGESPTKVAWIDGGITSPGTGLGVHRKVLVDRRRGFERADQVARLVDLVLRTIEDAGFAAARIAMEARQLDDELRAAGRTRPWHSGELSSGRPQWRREVLRHLLAQRCLVRLDRDPSEPVGRRGRRYDWRVTDFWRDLPQAPTPAPRP